jgi:small subunit ribosomal protein S18
MSSSTPNNSTQKIGRLLNEKAKHRGLVISRVRVRMQNKPKQDQKSKKRNARRNRSRWQTVNISGPAGVLDYKNATILRRHITVQGRILPRRFNHLTAKQQRHVARAIKRARGICLIATVRRRR